MEEELDKSMRASGINPAAGRLSTLQYRVAREELQRRHAPKTCAGCVRSACMTRAICRHGFVEE